LNKELEFSKTSGWKWNQYGAWCLRRGEYKTPSRKYTNWNHEYIWKMRMELQIPFDEFKEDIQNHFDSLIKTKISQEFRKLGDWASRTGFPPSVKDSFNIHREKLMNKVQTLQQQFDKCLMSVQLRTTEGNASSFIRAQMEDAYEKAAEQKSLGRFARQIKIIRDRLESKIFAQIMEDMDKEMINTIEDAFKDIGAVAVLNVNRFRGVLQSALDSDDRSDEDISEGKWMASAAREKFKQDLDELQERYEETIAPYLT
jgi:hypothetical protein